MKKNPLRTMRHVGGLSLISMPRAALLVIALVIAASIQLVSPWVAFAQPPPIDLNALEGPFATVFLPPTATSAQAATMQHGLRSWGIFLSNNSQTSVTNAAITVESGYDPSLFPGVTAFPVTYTQSTLTPGQELSAGLPPSNIPVNFTLGFDSTRAVSPIMIPVGGTEQTVTITMTSIDSRYAPTITGFLVDLDSNVPGVSVVSTTNPSNLDQGETIQTSVSFGLFQWQLHSPQLNKQYIFTAVLHVPNPFGVPFVYQPQVRIGGSPFTSLCSACPGSSITIKDATLDGNVPGSGGATFSVAETNHNWSSQYAPLYTASYQEEAPVGQAITFVVKPGSEQPAPINPKSNGKIPVAILTTASFDATTVDPTTVKFGVLGSEASSTQTSLEDVNGDGRLDMVLHFNTQQTGIVCGTTTVTLTGKTTSGQLISGTAPIRTVGCG
jgi:hypothetical protein